MRIIQIFFNELTSGGTINVDINASEVSSNGNDMNLVYSDSSWSYYISYLGDYNNSGYDEGGVIMDSDDIDTLITYWGTENYSYELGPCRDGNPCQSGDAPNFKPGFDENWDIEDLMAFVLMWNYSSDNLGRVKKQMDALGLPPFIEIVDNQIVMNLTEYTEPIHHIWYEVNTEESNLLFEPPNYENQFEMYGLTKSLTKFISELYLEVFPLFLMHIIVRFSN